MGGRRGGPLNVAHLEASRLDDGLASRAQRDGYLLLPGLVPVEAVHALRDLVLDEAAAQGWLKSGTVPSAAIHRADVALGRYDDPRWVQLLQRVLPDPRFVDLAAAPAILEVMAQVLGGEVEGIPGGIVRVVSSGDPAVNTAAHQDANYIEGEPSLWTAWLPLTGCPLRRGPLALLARSHHDGLRPHVGVDLGRAKVEVSADAVWSSAPMTPGDVLLFHGLTVHSSLPNQSGRLRLSVDFRYHLVGSSGSSTSSSRSS